MRRRVLASPYRDWVDPADVFSALYGTAENAFWLDSGIQAKAGMSYLGAATRVVTASVAEGTITELSSGERRRGTIFDFLRDELAAGIEPDVAAGPFQLGWVGWLGYELRAQTMAVQWRQQSRYPDAALQFADRAIAFDHAAGTVTLLALGKEWIGDQADWRDATVAHLASLSSTPGVSGLSSTPGVSGLSGSVSDRIEPRWAYSDEKYLAMIAECQATIANGDAYQLCLTTEARVDARPDPTAVYLALRASSPSHHGALLRVGEIALLSSSPEQFLSVTPEGVIGSKPIKGTRRRGATVAEDAALRAELAASDKERAENLMIVDLMRNDIGRVSAVGSVSVPRLLAVESYAQVHQLVSTVRGVLAEGVSPVDAVVACFPAGSMTGAPKLSATAILDQLEQRPRGIYSGVFGYFGLDGRVDLAMIIRSIVLDRDGATVGTGGGITALSVPTEELDEVKLKAAALLAVLAAAGQQRPGDC